MVSSKEEIVVFAMDGYGDLIGQAIHGSARAVLAHEIGHLALPHTPPMTPQMETEADARAPKRPGATARTS